MNESNLVKPVEQTTARTRLFYIASIATLILAGVLTVFLIFSFFEQNRQTEAIDDSTNKTNQLVQEVKELAEQNKALSQSAANYAYCNAVILAQYTQSQSRITIEDLDKCITQAFPTGMGAPTNTGRVQNNTTTTNPSTTNPTTNNSTTNNNTTTNNGGNTTTNNGSTQNGSGGVKTTPTGLLPGLELTLPCITVPNLLGICR